MSSTVAKVPRKRQNSKSPTRTRTSRKEEQPTTTTITVESTTATTVTDSTKSVDIKKQQEESSTNKNAAESWSFSTTFALLLLSVGLILIGVKSFNNNNIGGVRYYCDSNQLDNFVELQANDSNSLLKTIRSHYKRYHSSERKPLGIVLYAKENHDDDNAIVNDTKFIDNTLQSLQSTIQLRVF